MKAKIADKLARERLLNIGRNALIINREKKAKLVKHLQEDIKEQQHGIKRDKQAIKTLKSMKP